VAATVIEAELATVVGAAPASETGAVVAVAVVAAELSLVAASA
jgi:hypothetical protein